MSTPVIFGTLEGDVLPSRSSPSGASGRIGATPMSFTSIDRDWFLSAVDNGFSNLEPPTMAQMFARNTSLAFEGASRPRLADWIDEGATSDDRGHWRRSRTQTACGCTSGGSSPTSDEVDPETAPDFPTGAERTSSCTEESKGEVPN